MIGLSDTRSTIVAIASSTSPSLRGIVRISGDDAVGVLGRIVADELTSLTRPTRDAITLALPSPIGNLDATAYVWPDHRSYTGSPSVEIHTFGSLPILEAIVAAAVSAGARPARPGEFTMRAFLAGQLDLTQAEAVLGVIDANNASQLNAALIQLAGNVSAPLRQLRERLLDVLADVEAGLDFVDEDISFIDDASLANTLGDAYRIISELAVSMQARRPSESFHWVVLRGKPNAGKSSLLNALAGHNVALVSETSGTTRDAVWHEMQVDGYTIRLADTAGIETTDDEIGRQSQASAEAIAAAASIVLQCADVDSDFGIDRETAGVTLRVKTKVDTSSSQTLRAGTGNPIFTSAKTGAGLNDLKRAIVETLNQRSASTEVGVPATAARCGDAIDRASNSLRTAIEMLQAGEGQEWIASEIRQSLTAIGEITGEIYTDDVLDRVFSRFCIGK